MSAKAVLPQAAELPTSTMVLTLGMVVTRITSLHEGAISNRRTLSAGWPSKHEYKVPHHTSPIRNDSLPLNNI